MRTRHLSDAQITECAEGEADATRRPAVETHLGCCQRCALAVRRARDAAELVGRLPAMAAPASLRARTADAFLAEARRPISCGEAAPLLQEHIDGCLSPGAALMLKHHLGFCSTCRAEIAALTATTQALRELPAIESPARVSESVLEAQRRIAGPAPFTFKWKPALAAACAVLVVIGIAVVRPLNRPMLQPEVTLSAEAPPAAAPGRLEVARASEDSAGIAVEPSLSPAAVDPVEVSAPQDVPAPVALRMTPTIHTVAPVSKGPAPARVAPETAAPEVTMPSGLRALRVVAGSATYDAEVQRAMELAEAQYTTLHSEALSEARLAQLPAGLPDVARDEAGPVEGEDASQPSEPELLEEGAAPQPTPPSRPSREGATLIGMPLV